MIEVSEQTMDRIHTILAGVEKADEKVLKPALARGLMAARTMASKKVRETYFISARDFKDRSSWDYKKPETTGDEIVGSIDYSGFAIPLYKFKATPKSPTFGKKAVSVQVKRGTGGKSRHAFVAQMQSGHLGIFHRINKYSDKKRNQENKTKHNQMIEERYGPSVPKMIGNDKVIQAVEERVNEVINQRIEHEIERLLNQYG